MSSRNQSCFGSFVVVWRDGWNREESPIKPVTRSCLPVTGRRKRVEHASCERPTTVLGHVEHDAISTEVMSGGAWGAHLQLASEERGRGLILMKKLLCPRWKSSTKQSGRPVRLRWIRGDRYKGRAEG